MLHVPHIQDPQVIRFLAHKFGVPDGVLEVTYQALRDMSPDGLPDLGDRLAWEEHSTTTNGVKEDPETKARVKTVAHHEYRKVHLLVDNPFGGNLPVVFTVQRYDIHGRTPHGLHEWFVGVELGKYHVWPIGKIPGPIEIGDDQIHRLLRQHDIPEDLLGQAAQAHQGKDERAPVELLHEGKLVLFWFRSFGPRVQVTYKDDVIKAERVLMAQS